MYSAYGTARQSAAKGRGDRTFIWNDNDLSSLTRSVTGGKIQIHHAESMSPALHGFKYSESTIEKLDLSSYMRENQSQWVTIHNRLLP